MSDRLIQIVPLRAAAPEGVGDYATRIAEMMLARHGVTTRFIAATPLAPERRRRDRWETVELERRAIPDLVEALAAAGDAPVLLHLSGYGYQKKGVPLWVAEALRRWRRTSAAPLMTVVHELHAKGKIWGSAFWLGWAQILGARRIYRMSDAAITTTSLYAGLLRKWDPDGPPVDLMPCFATIGEPEGSVAAATERPARFAMFGRWGRKVMYDDIAEPLAEFVRANAIEEIVDIGPRGEPPPPAEVAGVPVRVCGELPREQLIDELVEARFGIVFCGADRVAKSSIFAALCASGVIPLVVSGDEGRRDGLAPGVQYLKLDPAAPPPAAPSRDGLDALQAGARSWYEPHSIAATVDLIHKRLLAGNPNARA